MPTRMRPPRRTGAVGGLDAEQYGVDYRAGLPAEGPTTATSRTEPHASGPETGFWDDNGRAAPWPDDVEDWTADTRESPATEPGQSPF